MHYSHFHAYVVYVVATSVNGLHSTLSHRFSKSPLPHPEDHEKPRVVFRASPVQTPCPLPAPRQLLTERLALFELLRGENARAIGRLAFGSEGGRGTPQGRREAGIEADALSESTRDTSRPADHAPTSAAPTSDKCGFSMKAKIAPPFRRENKLPLCYSIRKESLLGYKE